MPEPKPKRRSSPRPGNGGARPGSGPKPNSEKGLSVRSVIVATRVEPELAAWLKANGNTKLLYALLQKAYIESLIV